LSTHSAVTERFMGINRLEKVNDGEFKNCVNVLSDGYPALECGLGVESVGAFDKKIIKAFPNHDTGKEYMGFEGVFEDGSFEYFYYTSDRTLKKNTVKIDTDANLFRMGREYFDIKNLQAVRTKGIYADNPVSALQYITGVNIVFKGTVESNDDGTCVIFNSSRNIGFTPEPGSVLAFHISDAYLQNNSEAEILDTFRYNSNNVYSYTVTEATTTTIKCTAVKRSGELLKFGSEYTFDTSDFCYISYKYPEISMLGIHLNRAVGLGSDGSQIMLSKLGEYNIFYDYSGESTDSYSVQVADEGEFSGCISYNDILVVFKNYCMYGLYGDIPADFQLLKISSDIGCTDCNSISECNGKLYFLSQNGFYKYSGGKPVCISRKLGKKFKSAKSCSDGRRYYALTEDFSGKRELFVYDTDFELWYSLSFLPNDIFCHNGELYLVYDYEIKKINCDMNGEWNIESGNLSDDLFYDRAVTEIYVRVRIFDDDTFINSYTAADDKEFKPHITVSGKGFKEFYIPVRFEEGKSFRYKLEGSGKCVITDIKRIYSAMRQ